MRLSVTPAAPVPCGERYSPASLDHNPTKPYVSTAIILRNYGHGWPAFQFPTSSYAEQSPVADYCTRASNRTGPSDSVFIRNLHNRTPNYALKRTAAELAR